MLRKIILFSASVSALLSVALPGAAQQPSNNRWSTEQANAWYARQTWLVGSNYIPADAINELEMWQARSFNSKRIDMELGWGESLGMNTMRVFLHDLAWNEDKEGFKKRLDVFLALCQRHKIRPILVLFDSCWDPFPKVGDQREPRPGVHNSGWVQSPGAQGLQDSTQYSRLEAYVRAVVGGLANDQRVLAWDIWNEPDNTNDSSYGKQEPPNKTSLVLALLPKAFAWARSAHPTQPLTSGVWRGEWGTASKLEPMSKLQLELSDVTSFHNYGPPNDFERKMNSLKQYGRPLLCTEYMARGEKSTFQGILPIAKANKVAAMNWGFVAGKTQTFLPWDSWQQPYVYRSPAVWFHDIFHEDGTPYLLAEVAFIRRMTGVGQ